MWTWMFAALLAAQIGAPKTKPNADAPLIDDAELQQVGLTRFWEAKLPLTKGDVLQDAYLVDEALYVVSRNGRVFALKADVGLLRWGESPVERNHRIYPPRHLRQEGSSGPVVIPTAIGVFVMDRFTGQVRQRFSPPFVIGSAAVGYDNMLFAGGADGRFYSLQLDHPTSPEPPKRWEVLSGGPVTAAPLLYDGDTLLFASRTGTVLACLASDKTYRWSFKAGGAIEGDPAIDDTGVYISSADRSLYKLHRGIGEQIWRARFPSPLVEGPIATAQTVYQYCQGHGLTALDAATGKEKWRIAEGRTLAAHSAAGDVVTTTDAHLLVVDHDSGKVMGSIAAGEVTGAVSNPGDDSVYLLGTAGRVSCVRLDSVPYLRRQQVIAAKQALNQSPNSRKKVEPLPPLPVTEPDPLADDPLRSSKDVKP